MPAARLIYADSESDADLLYATRVHVPDPFVWFEAGGKTRAVLSRLEIDRARREAGVDEVLLADDFLPPQGKDRSAAALIANLAKAYRFKAVEVPAGFPLGVAEGLRRHKIKVTPVEGAFFPEREIKTAAEAKLIERAQRLAETGLARGLSVLRASAIGRNGVIEWHGGPLTSERLRGEIDAVIVQAGGLPANTIVAGGDQACDPHERGHGPLRAHQAIIIDIFPRDQRSGYFGDLTRTVVRGTPSAALEKLYDTVADGKAWALRQVKAGADGARIDRELRERFLQAGFPTEQRDGRWVGFFHGTGHSLGLEIHEAPRFGAGKFRAGHAMTVEPGLYFPGLGGVRLEDLVMIRRGGVRNLTNAPQKLRL